MLIHRVFVRRGGGDFRLGGGQKILKFKLPVTQKSDKVCLCGFDDVLCCTTLWQYATLGGTDGQFGGKLNSWGGIPPLLDGILMQCLSCVPPQRCELCKETGATVGCCTSSCSSNYHFQCARKAKCTFLTSKQVFCHAHREQAKDIEGSEELPESDVVVARRIFVDTNPQKMSRKVPRTLEAAKAKLQIGESMGGFVESSLITDAADL